MSRCMRPGPITSNGYLNYLREFRMKCCGLSAVETVRQGAKQWNRLSCKQKAKYRAMACKRPRRNKMRRSCRPKRRRRRGCRPKKRRRSCRPKRRRRRGCRPKKRRRSGCRKKRRPRRRSRSCRRRSRPRRMRRSCRSRRKRCMKPGPVTANAFLNFLRAYRRKHCGLSPQEAVKKGARRWCSMAPECKRRYMRQACKMSKSKRKKRSPLCRSFRKKRRC
ncbi:PREDICTED: protamine-like [Rhagoletis zephyria]|uniref:protamine-like n=1 Tax=Rhagoletis zephyria TaxID=28612 RepID=UPI000811841E|nr:PREDICTED: protamine-like [Rhagoletis zephyria]